VSAYAGVADTLAQARALPRAAFTDDAVFEAEVARVFRGGWAPVARESAIAPGSYLSADLFGAPLVVTREESGALHVLSRICRHRGMPVTEGAGAAQTLMCPYHLWRYGLDGKLLSAPAMEQSAAFAREDCALPRIRHESWGGWVFANLSGDAPALGAQLAPLAARLAADDPATLVTCGVIEFDSPWNWKVMIENFLESYHHIGPHAQSLQQTHPGFGTHEGAHGDLFTVLENPGVDADHAPFTVAAIFPLTLMAFSAGRLGVWYELTDITRTRFKLRVHLLAPPELAEVPDIAAQYREAINAIHLEDIPVCAGMQRGVESPFYQPGPLSHLEACLWRFHSYLKRALA